MMNANDPDHLDDDVGADAMVHALLQEELGATRDPAPALEAVIARFERGDGRIAATKLAAAEADANRSWLARSWKPLCAAAALLAVFATFARSWLGEPAGDGSRQAQDPRSEFPNRGAPRKAIPVESLAELRTLLPRVVKLELEVLRLPDPDIPFEVDLSGVPIVVADQLRQRAIADLAQQASETRAADADWQNRLEFVLDDGTCLRMAIYPYEQHLGVRLGVFGLDADLRCGRDGSDALRFALDGATWAARAAHGVLLSRADLAGEPGKTNGMPAAGQDEMRLFGVADDDLQHLARFVDVRKLDCAGLRDTLTAKGLRHVVRAMPKLNELVLDGMTLADDDLRALLDLVELERLSLRAVRGFTGTGFRHFSRSQKRRTGPLWVDLSRVPTLTDDGLDAIAEWDPEVLLLRGSGDSIKRHGFRSLEGTERLRELDMRDWPMNDKGMLPTIFALQRRPGFVLRQ
jgi:hypothetical protein